DSVAGIPGEGVTEGSFLLLAFDGDLSDTLVVSITVTSVNNVPIAVNDSVTTLEDSAVTVHILANDSDPEHDLLFLTDVTQGVHGEVVIDAGDTTVTYTPEANFFGPDSFIYTVSDPYSAYATAQVYVTVLPVNDPPRITSPASATATEEEPFGYRATAIDPEGDALDFTFDSLSSWLSVVTPDSVAGIPGEGVTEGSFLLLAFDGDLGDTMKVSITVVPVNEAPIAINDTLLTAEDSVAALAALLNDSDPDGDAFYLADTTWQASHGQVSIIFLDTVGVAGITFNYAPDADFFGSDSFSYSITDGVLFDTAMVLVTVISVNDAPEAFALLGPGIDTTTVVLTPDNIGDTLTFCWEPAEDIDGDSVWYSIKAFDLLETILPGSDITTTYIVLAHEDLVARMKAAGISDQLAGFWTVLATDGNDTTWAYNGPFGLNLDISGLDIDAPGNVPSEFALEQNYPNPFNSQTVLRFALPRADKVYVVVVDLLGREIAHLVEQPYPAGYHQVIWDGRTFQGKEAPSGVYIARMTAPGFVHQIKMVLLR
ncbi:MAG: tandem-95 repeat protein, partial [Candidatus Neomarinimicrobiota bacterium]